ncbi:hypothetical protein GCM10007874_59950 [Labrys miyagiensis]|uniref:Transposase IS801/IS1294 domain-containing protein n=1 Tax=Labrys miyagiensis TaxID=346912 RepID=A0ABQ6CVG0_9HYPH|nr:hypothetical protein GCM10007874_59950 [Labrys miyagiensis]
MHTWGQNLDHHPHVHCIIPGGGLSPDGKRWISCRPGFFLAVRVLSRLFRRLFLEGLVELFEAGQLSFFNDLAELVDRTAFLALLAPLGKREWVVYAKRPFAGPEQVLAYLARYTHRVAISNSRLVEMTDDHVAFRWKDYRQKGRSRGKTMTLAAVEFIRRFLLHILPEGFCRIRHYGLFANGHRAGKLALCRQLLSAPHSKGAQAISTADADPPATPAGVPACPYCGGRMTLVGSFEGSFSRPRPTWRADTS